MNDGPALFITWDPDWLDVNYAYFRAFGLDKSWDEFLAYSAIG